MRRRLHHGDVDGKRGEHLQTSGLDGLDEPLLGNHEHDDRHSEGDLLGDIWDDERKKERVHWMFLFSQLITQWAQWLANIVLGPSSLLGRFLPLHSNIHYGQNKFFFPKSLSPLQDALKQLWMLAYPSRDLPNLKSELWKDMGWQGSDPSTDFRGGGFISLENLIFFAQKYPSSFQSLLHKQDGNRADWEYPFAVAGINISFMLAQMLDIQSGKPSTLPGVRFLELLGEDELAFDKLYCVAFQLMDAQWLARRASYMEFNDVLKSTRTQLERELALEDVSGVEDLPAYNVLKR
ncbi:uncharacterized protein LOC131160325 isoform X2 [Malania oleifera]|uniref:uncharacterized protein LOC131160325 isoform X2 n=1 Tax=Malania oleifera TaxID=397392 RepID=UPI0025AE6391|nr:uncharacterized protein LOC131160325 isoform X2 [Malania oleifera]XP_057971885.1 uncharacterized protein LOC131160325 isoform X2 [Malania oleifera]XP_057971886.1 uncharacterized protein LOC131160325 isoform X2 [Malania oleifera]